MDPLLFLALLPDSDGYIFFPKSTDPFAPQSATSPGRTQCFAKTTRMRYIQIGKRPIQKASYNIKNIKKKIWILPTTSFNLFS
jgi:hypothetical protein